MGVWRMGGGSTSLVGEEELLRAGDELALLRPLPAAALPAARGLEEEEAEEEAEVVGAAASTGRLLLLLVLDLALPARADGRLATSKPSARRTVPFAAEVSDSACMGVAAIVLKTRKE